MREGKRFFVKGQGLGKDLVLRGVEHNHLAKVMRARVGDAVTVVCGDEFDYDYIIENIGRNESALKFVERKANEYNPKSDVRVYLGAIKPDNLAVAVQKLNEIGVSEVIIFKSANCQNAPVNIAKLGAIAEQSCKQCGRSIPLKVSGVIAFKELPKDALLCDVAGGSLQTADAIVIGPEGGLTEAERAEFKKRMTLGKRILRAETAAVVAGTLALNKLGEIC